MTHVSDQEAPPEGAGQYEQDPPVVSGSVRGYAHLHNEGAEGWQGDAGPLVGWANPSLPSHLRGFWDNSVNRGVIKIIGVILLIVWAFLVIGGVNDRMTEIQNHQVKTNVPATCTEDMTCWDCSTMGNHVCGVKP